MSEIQTTPFFNDFLAYYKKAQLLQFRNENQYKLPQEELDQITNVVQDPLMTNVHIYDCVERRQAGFSNALEDIHGKRSPAELRNYPDYSDSWFMSNKCIIRFIHLFHRFTGSGASFEKDHGYRNNHVNTLCRLADNAKSEESALLRMKTYIIDCSKPMVTSIGNQPPSLKNKEPEKYRLAMQYYFDNFAIDFILDYNYYLVRDLMERSGPRSIKQAVDFCCKWHKDRGFKQWKFVLTAFVMDDAEYYPQDVDPNSDVYFGSNCIKAFELMFTKPKKRMNKQLWHDECMRILADATGGQPYSLEDVACDMIRYWTEYIPKNGYNHLSLEQKQNNSILKVNGQYPEEVKKRIVEVCGEF